VTTSTPSQTVGSVKVQTGGESVLDLKLGNEWLGVKDAMFQ
jgi:hypothetical protein